jgi:serine/threonine-protein kinase
MNLTAGTTLQNGKYLLDTQLGKGVFYVTYQATNTESGQTVVIKTLAETLCQHTNFDQFKPQFLEFGERLRYCKHPNLVQVLDCFEDAGSPYLVMEYIPGQTLAELIESDVLPEKKAIEYIHQIGDALSVLHKAGLLHRDIKPQNIIRRQDTDCLVLCEFGITCEFTPGVMQTHATLLSAGYAPLEQYSFEAKRTSATDIYALAATLYCLLAGRPPLAAPVRYSKVLANLPASRQGSQEKLSSTLRELLKETTKVGQQASAQHADKDNRLFQGNLHPSPPKISQAVKRAVWRGLELSIAKRPQTVEAWLSLLPKPEKNRTPQPALCEPSAAQPTDQDSGQVDIKPVLKTTQPPQLPRLKKNPKLQSALSQPSVAKPEGQDSGQMMPSGRPQGDKDWGVLASREATQHSSGLMVDGDELSTINPEQDGFHPHPLLDEALDAPFVDLQTTPKQSQAYPPPKLKKILKSQSALVQQLVTKLKLQAGYRGATATKPNTPKMRLPLGALLITGAIAASAGLGFGLAIRTNLPNKAGSTFLHRYQDFPYKPMSDPRL